MQGVEAGWWFGGACQQGLDFLGLFVLKSVQTSPGGSGHPLPLWRMEDGVDGPGIALWITRR